MQNLLGYVPHGTTDLLEALNRFVFNSLYIKVAPYPKEVSHLDQVFISAEQIQQLISRYILFETRTGDEKDDPSIIPLSEEGVTHRNVYWLTIIVIFLVTRSCLK